MRTLKTIRQLLGYGLAGLLLTVSSCENMLDIESKRAVAEENMWQNFNDARAATFGAYSLLRAAMANENAYWAYGELRGGDFTVTIREDMKAVAGNVLNADYPTVESWRDWRRFYAAINHFNTALYMLPTVKEKDYRYSESFLQLDMAQIRVLRAFTYFFMVRLWGDVPLITEAIDGSFEELPKTSSEEVLAFVKTELEAAYEDLPWVYPTYYGHTIDNSIHITKGACLGVQAHVYAWEHDYTKALEYLDEMVNNQGQTGFFLTDIGGTTNFRGRNRNVVWQLDMNYDHAEVSTDGHLENWTLRSPRVPKSQADIYVPKDSIQSIYDEPNDHRLDAYFLYLNDPFPMFNKVRQLDGEYGNDPVLRMYSSAIFIFRYEELMLLRAECMVRTGVGGAVNELNNIRDRRGLVQLPGDTPEDLLLEMIFQERRRELIGEGWFWYDLVRFEKVSQYTNLTQDEVDAGAIYWPLANRVLEQNKQLEQNSFWK